MVSLLSMMKMTLEEIRSARALRLRVRAFPGVYSVLSEILEGLGSGAAGVGDAHYVV